MTSSITILSEVVPCGEAALCRRCARSVDTSEVCPTCGCCMECSASMPGSAACFNCVEVHRLVAEFLGALEDWDLERYGSGCATALRELLLLHNRLDEHC
jgi:hypothetical protein